MIIFWPSCYSSLFWCVIILNITLLSSLSYSYVVESGILNPVLHPSDCNCTSLVGENTALRSHLNVVKKNWEGCKADSRKYQADLADLRMQMGLKDLELSHSRQECITAKKYVAEVEKDNERLRKEAHDALVRVCNVYDVLHKVRKEKQEALAELEKLRFEVSQQMLMKN